MLLKNIRPDQYFSFFFCLILLLIQGSLSSEVVGAVQEPMLSFPLIKIETLPVINLEASSSASLDTASPSAQNSQQKLSYIKNLENISAQAYIVYDNQSSTVLLEKNANELNYPASSVKLMTALVSRDLYDLDDLVTIGDVSMIEGHRIGLQSKQIFTVKSLLTATLVNSGNDAALALAMFHPQGYEAFLQEMNRKAQQLSLDSSNFQNPAGLDYADQQTTARDLAILAKEVIKDPFLSELVSTTHAKISQSSIEVATATTSAQISLWNTNQLLYNYDQAQGVKTGTTDAAGQVLVSLWEEDNHDLLIVVMGSKNRYQDTLALVDWVRTNITWLKVYGL